MILDQISRKRSFSAFFEGAVDTLKFIEVMEQLGFALPDMVARRDVIKAYIEASQAQ